MYKSYIIAIFIYTELTLLIINYHMFFTKNSLLYIRNLCKSRNETKSKDYTFFYKIFIRIGTILNHDKFKKKL